MTSGSSIDWQPWMTLGGTGGDDIVQPAEDWLCVGSLSSLRWFVQVLGSTGCTLSIETSMGAEGPWSELDDGSFTAPVVEHHLASGIGVAQPMARYLRWRVATPGSGDWKICFRLGAAPMEASTWRRLSSGRLVSLGGARGAVVGRSAEVERVEHLQRRGFSSAMIESLLEGDGL